MLEYSFYTDTYKGDVITSSSTWDKAIRRATSYFNKMTKAYTVSYDTEENMNFALCAIAEVYTKIDYTNGVESESNGSYSVKYSSDYTSSSNIHKLILDEVSIYVDVYRGGDCCYEY